MSYPAAPLNVAAGDAHLDNGNAVCSTRGTSRANTIFLSPVSNAYATASAVNIARAGVSYVLGVFTLGGHYSCAEYLCDASSAFGIAERCNNASVFVAGGFRRRCCSRRATTTCNHMATLPSRISRSRSRLTARSASARISMWRRAMRTHRATMAQAVIADDYVDGGKATQELAIVGMRHRF